MASLFNDINSSDDSDDADYVPEASVSSDEEPIPSPSDEGNETKKKSRKKHKSLPAEDTKAEESKVSSTDGKERADDLFKSFLAEVEADVSAKNSESISNKSSCIESASSSPSVSSSTEVSDKYTSVSSSVEKPAELFDFAGETVSVSKDVISTTVPNPPVVKRKGLSNVLGIIQNKKPKLTTLTKSLYDWNSFKKEEGLEDELKQFNLGRGGFIERQRFLERSDLRSYELERDMRFKKKKT